MGDYSVLDAEHNVVPATLSEWGQMFQDPDKKRVAVDEVDDNRVSTVFLGMNHSWDPAAPPLWFETMTFGPVGEWCWRYSTWDEAIAGHAAVLAAVQAGTSLDDVEVGS